MRAASRIAVNSVYKQPASSHILPDTNNPRQNIVSSFVSSFSDKDHV